MGNNKTIEQIRILLDRLITEQEDVIDAEFSLILSDFEQSMNNAKEMILDSMNIDEIFCQLSKLETDKKGKSK